MCCQECRCMIHWVAGCGYRHDYKDKENHHRAKVIPNLADSQNSNRYRRLGLIPCWIAGGCGPRGTLGNRGIIRVNGCTSPASNN